MEVNRHDPIKSHKCCRTVEGWDGNGALIKCEVLKNSKLKLSMTRTNSKDNGRGEEGLDTFM